MGLGGALGQIDQLLLPYYEADIAAGRETDESVVWHLASLFFNDPHYSQIGGQGPDGRDLTSPLSYRVLEAMHLLRIPSNIALRVYEGMDRRLLRRALEYIVEDGTGVSFALSGGLDAGYARNGVPIGLARLRAKVGCNWTALPGIEYCLQDVTRVCLVTPLLLALDEVLALPAAERSMEALWERYARLLGESVAVVKEGKDIHMARQADNWPEIVLNLFCHGPVERGLDASAGGVDIVDLAMDAIGLATAADSFAAIEQRVVEEGRLSWEDLARHLAEDFAGAEPVRLMLASVPHYGAGGTRADAWAERIAALWTGLVRDTPTPCGYTCIPGLFSHGGTNQYGLQVGATPNGRRAGEPLSHSADPDPGFLPGGALAITAKANAVAAVQSGWGNTTPLQIEIDRGLVRGGDALETLEALIMTHNRMGGTLINMNVVSREQVLEAHEDPMTHPDLMIRVTGYSAYFRSLPRVPPADCGQGSWRKDDGIGSRMRDEGCCLEDTGLYDGTGDHYTGYWGRRGASEHPSSFIPHPFATRSRDEHPALLGPRRAGDPHDRLFQGLQPALLLVPQPRDPLAPAGDPVVPGALYRLWGVPGALPARGPRGGRWGARVPPGALRGL